MYFYATPANGSNLARYAEKISKNAQLRALLPLQGNDLLQAVSNVWEGNESLQRIPAHCGYETQPTEGDVFIVTQDSAVALCNTQRDALPGDHVSVVKPVDLDDPRYSRFATALREVEAKTPTVAGSYYEYSFSREGTDCKGVYALRSDDTWREEVISSQPCPAGTPFIFTQIADSGRGILLYDPTRGVYIKLPANEDGEALYSEKTSGPWGAIHHVRWLRNTSQ